MKYKRFISAVMACVMAFGMGTIPTKQTDFQPSGLTASGALEYKYIEGTYGGLSYTKYDTYVEITKVEITKCDENAETVDIPAEIEGLPVTEIGYSAFSGCTSLTSVTIPDSVTSIGDWAFGDCTSLTSVTIPESVTTIGENAFYYCTSLTSVTIPDSVTSIGDWAFCNCTSLTSIIIPDSVVTIETETFYECTNLTSVTIPDSVVTIELGAFCGCTSLTSVTIPDSVTEIEWQAFDECTSLTDVYYSGTEEQWNTITIEFDNEPLTNATIHFNSTAPEELEISVSSLIALNKALKTGKGAPKKYDLNGDGVVNVIDLALLKQKLLNK